MRLFLFVFSAILIFNGVSYSQTGPVKTVFDEATVYAGEGRFEEALEKYQTINVSLNDKEFAAKVRFNIGVCLYRLGQPEKAIAEYNKAVKLSGKYQKAYYAAGMAYVDLGRSGEAKAAFNKALELDKNDGEAWFDLGMVLLREKDYDLALAAFENTVKNNSAGSADALNNIGVINALKGDFLTAEKKFRTALAISRGNSVEAIKNLQICLQYKRNLNKELIAGFSFSREQKPGE